MVNSIPQKVIYLFIIELITLGPYVGRGNNRALTKLSFGKVKTKTWAYSEVSVSHLCAIAENPLPGGLETSGRREYR